PTSLYLSPLSLHDALPISALRPVRIRSTHHSGPRPGAFSEEADMTVHRSRLHRSARRRAFRSERRAPQRPSVVQRMISRLAADQGDVPGWVLITLMTAGIVVALWAVASEQIVQIFENAMAPFLGGSL